MLGGLLMHFFWSPAFVLPFFHLHLRAWLMFSGWGPVWISLSQHSIFILHMKKNVKQCTHLLIWARYSCARLHEYLKSVLSCTFGYLMSTHMQEHTWHSLLTMSCLQKNLIEVNGGYYFQDVSRNHTVPKPGVEYNLMQLWLFYLACLLLNWTHRLRDCCMLFHTLTLLTCTVQYVLLRGSIYKKKCTFTVFIYRRRYAHSAMQFDISKHS